MKKMDIEDYVYEANGHCDNAYAALSLFIEGKLFDMRQDNGISFTNDEWHDMSCVLFMIQDQLYETKQILNHLYDKGVDNL